MTWIAPITPFVTGYLVLVALMIGSFINLAADRMPRGESIVHPRSHCRACGRQLNSLDLLPVVGYLVRRGRCATCGSEIGAAAPAVEAVAGMSMLASILWLGLWPGAAMGLCLVAAWGVAVVSVSARRFSPAEEAR